MAIRTVWGRRGSAWLDARPWTMCGLIGHVEAAGIISGAADNG